MTPSAPKIVIVASTAGSVMNELVRVPFFRGTVHSVVSDRNCPAITRAAEHGIPTQIFYEKDKEIFCARFLEYLIQNAVDYVVSFFTKLFVGKLLIAYNDRIMNLHPSILPAFKGRNGFGDAVAYGVKYVGTTIHFIDEHMDEGKPIIQTIC